MAFPVEMSFRAAACQCSPQMIAPRCRSSRADLKDLEDFQGDREALMVEARKNDEASPLPTVSGRGKAGLIFKRQAESCASAAEFSKVFGRHSCRYARFLLGHGEMP